jgi:ankyrin repeat protein
LDKSELKDEGGRSPLQLLCSYGVQHPLLWKKYDKLSLYYTKEYYENNIEGVSTQYREIFKMLLHCDVFQKDDVFQWNCLDYAIRHHNLFAVEKILEKFVDSISLESLFDQYDTHTLAYYSSQMGYPNLLRATIKKDPEALSVTIGIWDMTLLHVAINRIKKNNELGHILMEKSKEVITTLIKCGLDVDGQCRCKRTTALHIASELDNDVFVKLLLEQGANINLTDNVGRNALHFALENSKANTEIVKLLIDKEIDVDVRDKYGITPLHLCCRRGHYDALVILLERGASVNAKDSKNYSVLHEAVFRKNYNCIKELLDRDADINAIDDFGKTVLHEAFEERQSPDDEVIELLLSRGVDANKRDNNQKTALDYAVTRPGSDELVKKLFHATARDQLMSTDYVTFLHYAVYQGNYFAVELFLEGGIDLDKISVNNREYPLHFAVENQHLRSDLLLKMTEFIRECKKKENFDRKQIVELLEKDFSK